MSDHNESLHHIKISRSDGKAHALHTSVFASALALANKDNSDSEKRKSSPHDNQPKTAEHDDEEHTHIRIHRSDGAAHDINEMMRAHTENQRAESTNERSNSSCYGRRLSGNDESITSSLIHSHYPSHVRIVHMSDTHNMLMKGIESCFLPQGDILVHTGDFTNGGTADDFAQFNDWLGSVAHKYHYRVVCLGSRDVKVFKDDWAKMISLLQNATHVLCHSEATILGIRFYGCPWHWGHLSNFKIRSGAPSSTSGRFNEIPEGINVVISHAAAHGRLDNSGAHLKEHWGSQELSEVLRRIKPGLHLHGHIKDSRGVLPAFAHAPLTLNSCMANRATNVLYGSPQVVLATNQRQITSSSSSKIGFGNNVDSVMFTFDLDNLISPTAI